MDSILQQSKTMFKKIMARANITAAAAPLNTTVLQFMHFQQEKGSYLIQLEQHLLLIHLQITV